MVKHLPTVDDIKGGRGKGKSFPPGLDHIDRLTGDLGKLSNGTGTHDTASIRFQCGDGVAVACKGVGRYSAA
jgi:hypothetical protein